MTKSRPNMANLLQSLCVEHYKFTTVRTTQLDWVKCKWRWRCFGKPEKVGGM